MSFVCIGVENSQQCSHVLNHIAENNLKENVGTDCFQATYATSDQT